ncbi:ATP-binding protein [Chitinophagaceae bacterium LWZ2-11]
MNPQTSSEDFFNRFKFLLDDDATGAFGDRFADSIPALVFVTDANKRKVRYINKQVTNMLGYDLNDVSGWDYDVTRFFFKDDLDSVLQSLDKLYNLSGEESLNYNARYAAKAGAPRYFETYASILKRNEDGTPASFLFVAQDITDKVKGAEEIKSLQTILKDSEDMLHYGLYKWDFVKDEFNWSDGIYKIYGFDKEQPISRDMVNNRRSAEENRKVERAVQNAIKTNSEFDVEFSYNKGGKIIWVQNKGKVVIPANPAVKATEIVGIVIEKTTQKQKEATFQKTLSDLKRSNKELEEFAYVASHDLQEPLRKVSTFGQILESKYSDQLGDEGKALLQRMSHATDNMRILIDNLLEFSRISSNKQPFKKLDLNELFDEIRTDLDLPFESNDISLTMGHLPVIECIPSQVKQVFNNLIGNAIKFRRNNLTCYINITAEPLSPDKAVELHLDSSKRYYDISVEDNGIGFEQEYAQIIFQLFQRLHGKSEYTGAGMGLSICKKIVDRHHGVIYAYGKEGEGSTFHVILPEFQ